MPELDVKLYSRPLQGDISRPFAAIAALEELFPDCRLEDSFDLEAAKNSVEKRIHVKDREQFLRQRIAEDESEMFGLCTRVDGPSLGASGHTIPGGLMGGREDMYDLSIRLPLEPRFIERSPELLGTLGDAMQAYWGNLSSDETNVRLSDQVFKDVVPGIMPYEPPAGLPMLWQTRRLDSPWMPLVLGWLNYWSRGTAALLRFPDPALDSDLLQRSRPTRDGGWVLAVTEEPLDLDIPAHVEALKRLYDRFPQIGGRDVANPP